jgi:tetratricopeptide (TPR) repeat protein
MRVSRTRNYDRRKILDEAERAQRRGQTRKVIRLYRWVLAVERNNPQLHARLAPLLARTGEDFDAWVSFRRCAETALREKREERALALYRDATRALPREIQAWQSLAHLLARRGEDREALAVLLEGSRHFRSRKLRSRAIHLLRRSRAIDAWHSECVLELARVLAQTSQREEALILLQGLAGRSAGADLRRVRGAQVRIEGSAGAFWRWLRCVITSGQESSSQRGSGHLHPDTAR